jgi:hypothetical protein
VATDADKPVRRPSREREVAEALARLRAALKLVCSRYSHPLIRGEECVCGEHRERAVMNGDEPNVITVDFTGGLGPESPRIFHFFRRQGLRRRADLRRQRRRKQTAFVLSCGDPIGRARLRVVK